MCGIAGYISKVKRKVHIPDAELMIGPIRQRGPDDEGCILISRDEGVYKEYSTPFTVPALKDKHPDINNTGERIEHDIALFHTRYSIIDLSSGGHQPFISDDKSVAAVFNGEIYNYIELREELSSLGVSFRTNSDTEVLVEGYRYWKDELWRRMNGFWAVVLYDFKTRRVVFSRDRIGVSPLYILEHEDKLFFASTIRALINVYPGKLAYDDDSILGFIETGIKDHNNSTFYSGIKTFPQSSIAVFDRDEISMNDIDSKKYWDFPKKRLTVNDISFEEAVEKYRETFFNAVNIRLRADVKVAFELSGGLDSSSVVAASAMLRNNNITTYTVKIKDADEEPYARKILKKYPVDYRVLTGIEDDFSRDYGMFSRIMEEPYDNPNDYTHYRMLKEMKEDGVHVVVTGAGGDEVLAGYQSSFWPAAYKEMKSSGAGQFFAADWYEFRRRFKTFKDTNATLKHYLFDGMKLFKSRPREKKELLNMKTSSASRWRIDYRDLSFHARVLYHFRVALVPYYMRSSDHFTMNIPMEHRFPFLDFKMVELGLTLPPSYLFSRSWTKYILRKAMEPYLPKEIVWRKKKMGFTFPFRQYFSDNITTFRPLIQYLNSVNIYPGVCADYDAILKSDPIKLWRLLSTAIWIKYDADKVSYGQNLKE